MILAFQARQTKRKSSLQDEDSTYIASDLKLTGVFNAPGQTVVIAGQFEGEMTAGSVEITSDAVFVGWSRHLK